MATEEEQSRSSRYYREAKSTASSAASRAGKYYSANTGAVLKGVAVIGGLGIGAYVVYRLLKSLTPDCTTPGSACYSALSGYTAQLNDCSTQFASNSNQFISEDAASGTGLTAAQEQILNYYKACMNDASSSIANTAKSYYQNPIQVMAWGVTGAILIAASAWGLKQIIPTLRTSGIAKSGAEAASSLYNSTVRALVNAGVIPPSAASSLATNIEADASAYAADDTAFWDALSALDVISVEDASAGLAEGIDAMGADFLDTVDILSGLVGQSYSPPAPLYATYQPRPLFRPCGNCP